MLRCAAALLLWSDTAFRLCFSVSMAMLPLNGAGSPMDGNAAADAATVTGACAAAATAPVHEWDNISRYCNKHKQKKVMNDYALRYFRWCCEDPVGVPCIRSDGMSWRFWDFDLSQDTCSIIIAHYQEEGNVHWFDDACEEQPWSWRHLLDSVRVLPQDFSSFGICGNRLWCV